MKHTPTPWKCHYGTSNIGVRVDNIDVTLANIWRPSWHEDSLEASNAAGANAEFIVRAVNSHDALLAACKALCNYGSTQFNDPSHMSFAEASRMAQKAIKAAEPN